MSSSLKYLSMIGAAASLLACAGSTQHIPPSNSAALPFASAEQAYLIGRGHHLAQRFDNAIAAYESALALEPEHVNTRNALATIYAEQGQFDRAILLWQSLTVAAANQTGPESAFLFSNLGYAMFLKGDYDGALAALEKACVLDPLNHRAWQHLGNALDKTGDHQRAAAMLKQAAALRSHDFRADYALAPRAGIAAIDSAIAAADEASSDWDETQVQKTASGMFVMRRISAKRKQTVTDNAVAPAVVRPIPDPVADSNPLVEIRNGNGVPGMARALAKTIAVDDWRVVRLTNHKGFGVKHTRVEYQPEFRDAAARLAARFGAAKVVQVDTVARADMRLVIGHDIVKVKAAPAALPVEGPVPVPRS